MLYFLYEEFYYLIGGVFILSKRAKPTSNTTNTLAIQKCRVKRIAVDYLGVALLMLLCDIIVLIVALTQDDKDYANRIFYAVIPILSVICAIFLFFSINRFLLLHAFNRARFYNEYTIKIDCKKIRFITYTRVRDITDIIGIKFVDINCQKYVYVLPKEIIDSKNTREEMRQKCVSKTIELICYKGTKMIKGCDVLNLSSNCN